MKRNWKRNLWIKWKHEEIQKSNFRRSVEATSNDGYFTLRIWKKTKFDDTKSTKEMKSSQRKIYKNERVFQQSSSLRNIIHQQNLLHQKKELSHHYKHALDKEKIKLKVIFPSPDKMNTNTFRATKGNFTILHAPERRRKYFTTKRKYFKQNGEENYCFYCTNELKKVGWGRSAPHTTQNQFYFCLKSSQLNSFYIHTSRCISIHFLLIISATI